MRCIFRMCHRLMPISCVYTTPIFYPAGPDKISKRLRAGDKIPKPPSRVRRIQGNEAEHTSIPAHGLLLPKPTQLQPHAVVPSDHGV